MNEDPITKAIREAASAVGVDVPKSYVVDGVPEGTPSDTSKLPVMDAAATVDPGRFVVPDGMHRERPKPMPYNGMDIVGYSIQSLIDDMDRDFDIDRYKGMFGFNW